MIFATVGTHEQQFNRLIKAVDDLKTNGMLNEEVIIQTGYSDYEPKSCTFNQFYSYQQMLDFVNKARIVITHGGPSSFIMPLQIGKIPIVVPRQKKFEEHVNDHQLDFCNNVSERQGNILLVEDIEELSNVIKNYDQLIAEMPSEMKSNNAKFCSEFEKIIDGMFGGN